jgi:signal transduction histidine kinase
MFKEKYVRLLIVFTVLFWIAIFVRFYGHAFKHNNPIQLQKTLQEDVFNKSKAVEDLLDKKNGDVTYFKEQLPKQVYFFLYTKQQLTDWNTNLLLPDTVQLPQNTYKLTKLGNSIYIGKEYVLDSNRKLKVLIPIYVAYPVEHAYLVSHFVADSYIPSNALVSASPLLNGWVLKDAQQHKVAYVFFNAKDIKLYPPDAIDIFLVILAVFFTYASINVSNLIFTKKRSQWKGLLFSILIITFFRTLLYVFGIPFHARTLDFFSPLIYSKNHLMYSLGDLFFNALGFMWIISYVYKHTQYTQAFKNIKTPTTKIILLVFIALLSVGVFYESIYLTHSIIMDSNISFDIRNVKNVSSLSFAGLVIMCLISGTVALALNIFNFLLNNLTENRFLKYGLLLLCLLICLPLLPNVLGLFVYILIILWFILFYVFIDYFNIKITSDISELSTIFWLSFVCFSFTGLFMHFINNKEQLNKKAVIIQLSMDKIDDSLSKSAYNIPWNQHSTLIFNKPTTASFLSNTYQNSNYSVAKYVDGKLIYQISDFAFPLFSKRAKTLTQPFNYLNTSKQSWLWFKKNQHETFVIVQESIKWFDALILFSYLFGISVLIILLIITYRLFATLLVVQKYKKELIAFNFRKRTHYAMLSMVLISFLILATITIAFLYFRFKQNEKATLITATHSAQLQFEQYVHKQQLTNFETLQESTAFDTLVSHLVNLSKEIHADINVYDIHGKLIASSNTDLLRKGIIAPLLTNAIHKALDTKTASLLITDEQLGSLTYQVGYMYLYAADGAIIGYISTPIFSSQQEMRYEITYLIITMTNLYAFIFVFSTIIAFFITNGLTKSFNIIIKQFQRTSLKNNETIDWPYDDEIGLMVREYNKMIKKLEVSAHQLAQSEREDAWKDMAKQVAHEIKNPLTPMRLNLQFLQNAINNKQDNTLAITKKVTDSLIEQIDNLNYIASEFSNFAKLPDPQVASFSLNTILENSVSIYKNESNITISLSLPNHQIMVRSDKSQLLRVFSNLLQNAVQAIPEGKQGIISVNLYIQNQQAVVQVKDNGVGMPPATQSNVFVPHFTTKNSGSGIGLAMSKRIIEYWNGSIWFESIENDGTDFYIKLPILEQRIT